MIIRIYTDGSCLKNPGEGGWAFVINFKDEVKEYCGGKSISTNNEMELTAFLKALLEVERLLKSKRITHKDVIEIYSDSAYVVNAINNNWVETWKENGWRTKKNEEIKNKKLWMKTYVIMKSLTKNIDIVVKKVRGHSGNTFNDLVDRLARSQAEKYKSKR